MPQEHLATFLTALFAPGEAATPQTNPLIAYGAVLVLVGAVALALWASRPWRRGLGQKLLTPRPDGPDGLPWMPGGDIFETDDESAAVTPAQPVPSYQPAPNYQPEPTYYQPEPSYRPVAGAPQFVAPRPAAAPGPLPPSRGQPRNPWSTG